MVVLTVVVLGCCTALAVVTLTSKQSQTATAPAKAQSDIVLQDSTGDATPVTPTPSSSSTAPPTRASSVPPTDVFSRTPSFSPTSIAWDQLGPDEHTEGNVTYSYVGWSVLLAGDDGTTLWAGGGRTLRMYRHDFTTGAWIQRADLSRFILQAATTLDQSADGSTIIVGDPQAYANFEGQADIFTNATGTWARKGLQPLWGREPEDHFGYAVSVSGDGKFIAVSSGRKQYVRFYEWELNAQAGAFDWADRSVIVGSWAYGFATSMSDDGTKFLLAAPRFDEPRNMWVGTVQIIDPRTRTMLQSIDGGDDTSYHFGFSVSMSGNGERFAAGDSDAGVVKTYRYDHDQQSYVWHTTIVGPVLNLQFGWDVSLSVDGSRLAVGAPQGTVEGDNPNGSTMVYKIPDGDDDGRGAVLVGEIQGEHQGDMAGVAVAMSRDGAHVAIGAAFNDDAGDETGHVRVYRSMGVKD